MYSAADSIELQSFTIFVWLNFVSQIVFVDVWLWKIEVITDTNVSCARDWSTHHND